MGWIQSPTLFTAAMETVADLAHQQLINSIPITPHRLDVISKTPSPPLPNGTISAADPAATPLPPKELPVGRPSPPVKRWDVYADDFV
jgi:hypothetical protein